MAQYINKDVLIAEIRRHFNEYSSSILKHYDACKEAKAQELGRILTILDTLEVKEEKTLAIPKYSYFEYIYHCGSEPKWKIGDVLAVYEFYSDYEGEHIYGKITDIKMGEDGEDKDWLYTFENGDEEYENVLISDEAYKKK